MWDKSDSGDCGDLENLQGFVWLMQKKDAHEVVGPAPGPAKNQRWKTDKRENNFKIGKRPRQVKKRG